jgi:hypothetical protein
MITSALIALALTSPAVSPVVEETIVTPMPSPPLKAGITRDEIREMPILERPYRAGHFYGNTVRRRHHRTELR